MSETRQTHPTAEAVQQRYRRQFGGAPTMLCFAPGRVNLVGNHVDYNGGVVLPLAVDRGVFVALGPTSDGRAHLHSLDCEPPLEMELAAIGERCDPAHAWASYPLGVLRGFAEQTGVSRGVAMVFGGDLPIASGLSSSAAIEVATGFALDALHGTGLSLVEVAQLGFRAENHYIGLQCGIMDQFASALGRLGQVLILDCANQVCEYAPFDAGAVDLLLLDTRVPRTLAGSAYNQRVAECAEALDILQLIQPRAHLADYTVAELEAAQTSLPPVPQRRAAHVIQEVQRVGAAVVALRAGDLVALGRCLDASHASSRDLYEVSCPELDWITAAARECDEVFGARLTGAGFGGCAIALLEPGSADAVQAHIAKSFAGKFGMAPGFALLHAGPGPAVLGDN